MKTFKMLSLKALHKDEHVSIPLIDGIIINQENSHRSWILEIYIDEQHLSFFDQFEKDRDVLDVQVVISYPENEPATFRVVVHESKEIGRYVSVLMQGTLKGVRKKYAEQLLTELVDDGLSGQALIDRFEEDMRMRPRLKSDKVEAKN